MTDEELSPSDEAKAPGSSREGATDAGDASSPRNAREMTTEKSGSPKAPETNELSKETVLRARWAERRAALSDASRARAVEASESVRLPETRSNASTSTGEPVSPGAPAPSGVASKDTALRARWAERRAIRSGGGGGGERARATEDHAPKVEAESDPAPEMANANASSFQISESSFEEARFDQEDSEDSHFAHPGFDSRSFEERSGSEDEPLLDDPHVEGPAKPRLNEPAPYVPGRLLSRAKPPFWSLEKRPFLRKIAKPAGLFCLASVIVVNAVFITQESLRKPAVVATSSASAQAAETPAPPSTGAPSPAPSESLTGVALDKGAPNNDSEDNAPSDDHNDPTDDETPKIKGNAPPSRHVKKAQTVGEALTTGCSTSSVDALSRQIVAEARCINADAFAIVPKRPNLVISGNVSLRLEAPARDRLLHVLDAFPHRTMTVNSALRTVAQQFLLDHWAHTKRCGIELAARPGESNHESGLALDVKEHGTWRTALEAQGFRWLGPTDRVHFDFKGPGASQHDGLDVLAFQRLWNRNHPDDAIAENGHYDAPTEAHLRKAPAQGFASGPACGRRQADRAPTHPHGAAH